MVPGFILVCLCIVLLLRSITNKSASLCAWNAVPVATWGKLIEKSTLYQLQQTVLFCFPSLGSDHEMWIHRLVTRYRIIKCRGWRPSCLPLHHGQWEPRPEVSAWWLTEDRPPSGSLWDHAEPLNSHRPHQGVHGTFSSSHSDRQSVKSTR